MNLQEVMLQANEYALRRGWTQGGAKKKKESRYMPHNGDKEKARRARQLEKGMIKCSSTK